MTVRFDESLPIIVREIDSTLGEGAASAGVVLRDTAGRLTFFSGQQINAQVLEKLSKQLQKALEGYARTDRVIANLDASGAADILSDDSFLLVQVGAKFVKVIDRRLAGGDWLRYPAKQAPPPPRFVFFSLKGGVGRSTALSVVAADLAARGRRVLAVDLDMEAPGLGAMLLDRETLPEFGLVDALTENNFGPLDDTFMADLVAASPLADRNGRIDVVPAFGRRCLDNPGDILAKIARAYLEDLRESGGVATILDQVQSLVDRFSNSQTYDAILVDARAGLHETAAAAVLGLGAEVLCFGLNEPQTFQGYAAFFAHLGRFMRTNEVPEWVERLTMVQGRTPDSNSYSEFSESCRSLISQTLLARVLNENAASADDQPVPLPAEPFSDVPWNEEALEKDPEVDDVVEVREAVAIFDDPRFQLFQPHRRRDLLTEGVYRSSYGMLLDRVNESMPTDDGGRK